MNFVKNPSYYFFYAKTNLKQILFCENKTYAECRSLINVDIHHVMCKTNDFLNPIKPMTWSMQESWINDVIMYKVCSCKNIFVRIRFVFA